MKYVQMGEVGRYGKRRKRLMRGWIYCGDSPILFPKVQKHACLGGLETLNYDGLATCPGVFLLK